MQSQSHIFSLQFPLCHKHYQLSLFFVEKNNTLKKFVAGSSTEFAMVVWFAVPEETRATVRYIVFHPCHRPDTAGEGHLPCVAGAASCRGGRGDRLHNQTAAKLGCCCIFSILDLIASFFTESTLV